VDLGSGSPLAVPGARAGKARISAQAGRILVSSHQPSLTSLRGSLDEKCVGAMMSAMRDQCIGGLQLRRCSSAGTQDFCAVLVQRRGLSPSSGAGMKNRVRQAKNSRQSWGAP
jgi:hypothetical protein